MPDLGESLRSYVDFSARPVTLDEVITRAATHAARPSRSRQMTRALGRWFHVRISLVVLAITGVVGASTGLAIALTGTGSRPTPTTTVPSSPLGAVPSAEPGIPAGFEPASFTAVSDNHWWVSGLRPCNSSTCLAIVTTTDGGRTFWTLPTPEATSQASSGLSPIGSASLTFADAHDGWLADGQALYATHDGGIHWRQITLPGIVSGVVAGLGEVFAEVAPPEQPCSQTLTCTDSSPGPQLWRAKPWGDGWRLDTAAGTISAGLAVHGRSVWVGVDPVSWTPT